MSAADSSLDSIRKEALQRQGRVSRLLKAIERRGGELGQDPGEIILQATAYDTDRQQLVDTLKAIPYTFGVDAPSPQEGRIPGTWDQVVSCLAQEMLSIEEFNEVRRAVGL